MGALKFDQHKKIVRSVVERIAKQGGAIPDEDVIVITDDVGGHYALFNNGWEGSRRFYGCYLHIDVHPDGKVWLQHDGTDEKVALELIEAGIPQSDIVLAFHPPAARKYTEYALDSKRRT
jgi:hypothetical protein